MQNKYNSDDLPGAVGNKELVFITGNLFLFLGISNSTFLCREHSKSILGIGEILGIFLGIMGTHTPLGRLTSEGLVSWLTL